jgi:hypothetical protein
MLKRLTRLSFLFLFLMLFWSNSWHKFYVSHFTLEYRNQSVQITGKIFADDIEKALQKTNPAIRINEKSDPKIIEESLKNYLNQHIKLSFDGKDQPLNWVGYELENDLVWVYFEVKNRTEPPINLLVFCDVLTEIYDDQVSIFRVDIGKMKETFALRKDEKSHRID